jgi:DNA-binding LytR/AlgR family response regulator
MNILICDDDPIFRTDLKSKLEKIAIDTEENFRISEICSGEQLLNTDLSNTDILFLDIMMQSINGMNAARILRSKGIGICIIFITSMIEYALEGYEVEPFGYLLKPVDEEKLKATAIRACQRIKKQKGQYLDLQTRTGISRIQIKDILFIQVWNHQVEIVCENKKYNVSTALNTLQERLDKHTFFRCHNSYLINLRAISVIGLNSVTMRNGTELPLSRHRKKELLTLYAKFLGEKV